MASDDRNGGLRLVAVLLVSFFIAGTPSHSVRPLWRADAVCETGSNPPNWRFHAGSYEGGIAFYASTWTAWRAYVPAARPYVHAYQAPAWVQAVVAEYGLDHYGRWGCLYKGWVWRLR